MAIPYNTTSGGTSIRDALVHSSIKDGGTWRHLEKIHVKHSNSWQETKEVYVKSGGSWRLVHQGEHFLFNAELTSNSESEWSLASYLSGQGYSSGPIKGAVQIKSQVKRRQINLGNFSGDSLIYLRVDSNCRIQAKGGNGGNAGGGNNPGGGNGQNGQRALYSKTNFILDNAGIIAGGGGGG